MAQSTSLRVSPGAADRSVLAPWVQPTGIPPPASLNHREKGS